MEDQNEKVTGPLGAGVTTGDIKSGVVRAGVVRAGDVGQPVAAPEFPNKDKYEDGFVFNLPISHYANRTEARIRKDLIDGRNEKGVIEPHMDLIREALAFWQTDFADRNPDELTDPE